MFKLTRNNSDNAPPAVNRALIVLGNRKSEVESEVNRGKKRDQYWLTLLLHVSGRFASSQARHLKTHLKTHSGENSKKISSASSPAHKLVPSKGTFEIIVKRSPSPEISATSDALEPVV